MTPVIVKGQAVELLQQVSIVTSEFLEEKRCRIERHDELMSARRTEEFEFQLDLGRKALDGFSDQHFLGVVDLYAAIVEQTAEQQRIARVRRGESENGFLIGPGRQPESQITFAPSVGHLQCIGAASAEGTIHRDLPGLEIYIHLFAACGAVDDGKEMFAEGQLAKLEHKKVSITNEQLPGCGGGNGTAAKGNEATVQNIRHRYCVGSIFISNQPVFFEPRERAQLGMTKPLPLIGRETSGQGHGDRR
jgi:hypothetical protein